MAGADYAGLMEQGAFGGEMAGDLFKQQKEMNTLAIQQSAEDIKLTREQIQTAPVERQRLQGEIKKLNLDIETIQKQQGLFKTTMEAAQKKWGLSGAQDDGRPKSMTEMFADLSQAAASSGDVVDMERFSKMANANARADAALMSARSQAASRQAQRAANINELVGGSFGRALDDPQYSKADFLTDYSAVRGTLDENGQKLGDGLVERFFSAEMQGKPVDWRKAATTLVGMTKRGETLLAERARETARKEAEGLRERAEKMRELTERNREAHRKWVETNQTNRGKIGDKGPTKEWDDTAKARILKEFPGWRGADKIAGGDALAAQAWMLHQQNGWDRDTAISTALTAMRVNGTFGEKGYTGGGLNSMQALTLTNDTKPMAGHYYIDNKQEVRVYMGIDKDKKTIWYPPIGKPGLSRDWKDFDEYFHSQEFEALSGVKMSDAERRAAEERLRKAKDESDRDEADLRRSEDESRALDRELETPDE